jgi:hypothetical protein
VHKVVKKGVEGRCQPLKREKVRTRARLQAARRGGKGCRNVADWRSSSTFQFVQRQKDKEKDEKLNFH